MENTYALIMAGGVGSRFWPKSRNCSPKQYLTLVGTHSMLQAAARRMRSLVSKKRIFVVTTLAQHDILQRQLPWIAPDHLIVEPFGKNTAPCIGLSAIHIQSADPDAVMIVLPADHLISDEKAFHALLRRGVELVYEHPGALITIGIEPAYPATGYGYIQRGRLIESRAGRAFQVRAFAEKPNREVAEQFFHSGEFLWNSGIFIWRVQTILNYLEELMPDLYDSLCTIRSALGSPDLASVTEKTYKQIYSDSIDYGVMEKAKDVYVLEGDFGWSDLGSWEEVYNVSDKDQNGNVVKGEPILKGVRGCYIESDKRQIAMIGAENLIVVDTPDALLICDREHSQDVKWLVEKLKQNGLENLL
jgi:mannose-1-phosphate guanylyltransferase